MELLSGYMVDGSITTSVAFAEQTSVLYGVEYVPIIMVLDNNGDICVSADTTLCDTN